MSLTDWTNYSRDLIDALYDKPDFNIRGELKAQPLTGSYTIVETAFDYAIRLQVARFNANLFSDFPLAAQLGIRGDKKRKGFIDDFEGKSREYLRDRLTLSELLPDCIILAKMEAVSRSGKDIPNADIFSVDEPDIVDLQILTGAVNPIKWTAANECFISPGFGKSSLDIGGADADFIIDGTLIDVKTTKELDFKQEYFRQLLGYNILNERENHMYGKISSLGIYFSRFGLLFTFPSPEMNRIAIDGNPANAWEAIEESIVEYRNLQSRNRISQ